jgi:uncharacterized protein YeaO (DUF488 family)
LELLRDYQARIKKNKKDPDAWPEYERRFADEIASRPVVELLRKHTADTGSVCFLCTEPKAEHCHRRLLAEYLQANDGRDIEIIHL